MTYTNIQKNPNEREASIAKRSVLLRAASSLIGPFEDFASSLYNGVPDIAVKLPLSPDELDYLVSEWGGDSSDLTSIVGEDNLLDYGDLVLVEALLSIASLLNAVPLEGPYAEYITLRDQAFRLWEEDGRPTYENEEVEALFNHLWSILEKIDAHTGFDPQLGKDVDAEKERRASEAPEGPFESLEQLFAAIGLDPDELVFLPENDSQA